MMPAWSAWCPCYLVDVLERFAGLAPPTAALGRFLTLPGEAFAAALAGALLVALLSAEGIPLAAALLEEAFAEDDAVEDTGGRFGSDRLLRRARLRVLGCKAAGAAAFAVMHGAALAIVSKIDGSDGVGHLASGGDGSGGVGWLEACAAKLPFPKPLMFLQLSKRAVEKSAPDNNCGEED